MLGPAKAGRLDELVITSLELLVPPGNPYRDLEAKLDLSFVRDWVGDLYADCGRPSIDPVVFFKLQLILFFDGLRSERKLIETASLHLGHRWYLGYALSPRGRQNKGVVLQARILAWPELLTTARRLSASVGAEPEQLTPYAAILLS
jgi:Transposase domain (DUF772)